MITIYCTTSYWNNGTDDIPMYENGRYGLQEMSENELLEFIEKQGTRLLKVIPNNGIFRDKFIIPFWQDGYPVEGIYQTELMGKLIRFRLIVDINCK